MWQIILRYLGLDRETKTIRRMARRNYTRAGEMLDELSAKLANSSRGVKRNQELSRAIRNSEFEFGKQRRRAIRT